MTIKITLEFNSVEETIVALSKLMPPPAPKKAMTNPDALKTVAELTAGAPSSKGEPQKGESAGQASAAPAPQTKRRPGRPPKNATAASTTPGLAGEKGGNASSATTDPGSEPNVGATPMSTTAQGAGRADPAGPAGAPTTAAVAPQTAAPVESARGTSTLVGEIAAILVTPSSAPVDDTAAKKANQAVIEKVYLARGAETAMQLLARFGVKRVRELLPAQYTEFVKHGEAVAAGGEV